MIIMVLRGGLGNQMYEYASARAMALRTGENLVLNTKLGFITDKVFFRKYCLYCFNLKYISQRFLSFDIPGGVYLEALSRKLGFHILAPWYKVIFDDKVNIEEVKAHPNRYRDILMQGTWNRTDSYFDDYLEEVLDDFQLNWPLPAVVKSYLDKIQKSEKPVVALGIRLFQEIKDRTNTPERQSAPDVEYVKKAVKWYQDKYGHVKLMIFTQVKQWFLDNFPNEHLDFEFVETGGDDTTAVFDMFLFSQCNHYILTNSTFYAWGEKLNRNNNKDVVIPKNWALTSKESWIRL